MKKYNLFVACLFCLAAILPLSAATYDNNEFQRKSRAYSDLAAKAYDEGDYDASVNYAAEAEKTPTFRAPLSKRQSRGPTRKPRS